MFSVPSQRNSGWCPNKILKHKKNRQKSVSHEDLTYLAETTLTNCGVNYSRRLFEQRDYQEKKMK